MAWFRESTKKKPWSWWHKFYSKRAKPQDCFACWETLTKTKQNTMKKHGNWAKSVTGGPCVLWAGFISVKMISKKPHNVLPSPPKSITTIPTHGLLWDAVTSEWNSSKKPWDRLANRWELMKRKGRRGETLRRVTFRWKRWRRLTRH